MSMRVVPSGFDVADQKVVDSMESECHVFIQSLKHQCLETGILNHPQKFF